MNNLAQQNPLSQLKDIKPLVAVPDNSIYIFSGVVILILLIISFAIYKYLTRVKKSKQLSQKQLAFKRLKNLNFNNTKDVVYSFSVDGFLFVNDKNKAEFEQIEKQLEAYKYKKQIEKLPKELEEKIKKFIKGIKR